MPDKFCIVQLYNMGLPAVVSLLCARKVASPSRRRHHTPPPSPTTMSRFTTALAACAVLDSVASAQKPSCSAARGAPYRQHDGNAAVTNGRTPVKRSAHRAPSEARPSHVVCAEHDGRIIPSERMLGTTSRKIFIKICGCILYSYTGYVSPFGSTRQLLCM